MMYGNIRMCKPYKHRSSDCQYLVDLYASPWKSMGVLTAVSQSTNQLVVQPESRNAGKDLEVIQWESVAGFSKTRPDRLRIDGGLFSPNVIIDLCQCRISAPRI